MPIQNGAVECGGPTRFFLVIDQGLRGCRRQQRRNIRSTAITCSHLDDQLELRPSYRFFRKPGIRIEPEFLFSEDRSSTPTLTVSPSSGESRLSSLSALIGMSLQNVGS
jgi:hypothetical protein